MWILVTFMAAWLGGVAAQPPAGAISGRIVDEKGKPVPGAEVSALRAEYIAGGRRLRGVKSTRTDGRGDFRLEALPAGKYYVTASGPREIRDTAFAPTFYPGTAMATDGLRVEVRAGQETVAIDFALTSVRLARVAGFVLESSGKPAVEHVVLLNADRSDGAIVLRLGEDRMTQAGSDGSFGFANVAPGEYRVDVLPKSALEEIARTGRNGLPQTLDLEFASVPVTVNGEDIQAMKIATKAGRRLSGRIVVEGATTDADVLSRMTVSTYDPSYGRGLSGGLFLARSDVDAEGAFVIRGVSGSPRLRVSGLPKGWALESVRWSGADVTDTGVEMLDRDVADVEVIVTARPAGIVGTVVNAMNRPIGSAFVIVFPRDRELWGAAPNRHLAFAKSAADGSFTISPLPAGKYFISVVDDFADGEWGEPDRLDKASSHALRMELGEGETKRLTVRAPSAERRAPI